MKLPAIVNSLLVTAILFPKQCESVIDARPNKYRLVPMATMRSNPQSMSSIPKWVREMVRIERDGSSTIHYLRGHRQALNLYFELPEDWQNDGFHFSVSIDNLDSCNCVTESVYENLLPFTYNRVDGRKIMVNEIILLSWNFWHEESKEDGREFYFSATNGNEFSKANHADWTDLAGMHRRAQVHMWNGTIHLQYGKKWTKLRGLPTKELDNGSGERRLRFRLISQRELVRIFEWLPGAMANGRATPFCDWTLNFVRAKWKMEGGGEELPIHNLAIRLQIAYPRAEQFQRHFGKQYKHIKQ